MKISPFIKLKAVSLTLEAFEEWSERWMKETKAKIHTTPLLNPADVDAQAKWFDEQVAMMSAQLQIKKAAVSSPAQDAADTTTSFTDADYVVLDPGRYAGTELIVSRTEKTGKLYALVLPEAEDCEASGSIGISPPADSTNDKAACFHATVIGGGAIKPADAQTDVQKIEVHSDPPPYEEVEAALGDGVEGLRDGEARERADHRQGAEIQLRTAGSSQGRVTKQKGQGARRRDKKRKEREMNRARRLKMMQSGFWPT